MTFELENNCSFTPIKSNSGKPSYWTFLGYVENSENFIEYMNVNGVQCSSLHQRNDIYSCFNTKKIQCTQVLKIEKKLVGIPCGWWLSKQELDFIVAVVKKYDV